MGKYQSGDFLPASINRNYNKYRERERERESDRYMIAAKYIQKLDVVVVDICYKDFQRGLLAGGAKPRRPLRYATRIHARMHVTKYIIITK